ncbi:MAG: DUF2721 domain-containing protein [Verrucomicrobia bacterium]|nr:DUF2721 domain-containing protein [Verrucomicrobiota bacterium]
MTTTVTELLPILQSSIGPVILISGVGLLLLTMTNRFGRTLDRTRQLKQDLAADVPAAKRAAIETQIGILMRRAGILRASITLGAVTVLLDAVLMLLLFLSAWARLELGGMVIAVFCVSQGCLIGSMVAFILDLHLALAAVRLEVGQG